MIIIVIIIIVIIIIIIIIIIINKLAVKCQDKLYKIPKNIIKQFFKNEPTLPKNLTCINRADCTSQASSVTSRTYN